MTIVRKIRLKDEWVHDSINESNKLFEASSYDLEESEKTTNNNKSVLKTVKKRNQLTKIHIY